MSDNLRIGQIAKKLDVSTATVRNWIQLAENHLPPEATRKTNKRFNYEDLNTLQTVKRFLEDGHTWEEIPSILDRVLPTLDYEVIDPDPAEQPTQDTSIAPVEFFEHITNMLNSQAEQHQREIASKDEFIDHLREENTRLHEELENERKPWWKKIF